MVAYSQWAETVLPTSLFASGKTWLVVLYFWPSTFLQGSSCHGDRSFKLSSLPIRAFNGMPLYIFIVMDNVDILVRSWSNNSSVKATISPSNFIFLLQPEMSIEALKAQGKVDIFIHSITDLVDVLSSLEARDAHFDLPQLCAFWSRFSTNRRAIKKQ